MDFIERIFHIAPDGGTGLLELAFLVIILAIPSIGLAILRSTYWRQRP